MSEKTWDIWKFQENIFLYYSCGFIEILPDLYEKLLCLSFGI